MSANEMTASDAISSASSSLWRRRLVVRGAVQGVGFRPFVYRLATELRLTGCVQNTLQGVIVEIEGDAADVAAFGDRLRDDLPPPGFVERVESSDQLPTGARTFEILGSDATGRRSAVVPPDLAMCNACRDEIMDPSNRRFRYPFTNCTHCGPRFTIIESMPYDRANTSMRGFTMCPDCRAEYDDPRDRRFHAQPNACPRCGPQLEFCDCAGRPLAARDDALHRAAEAIRDGLIVSVKGIGGFHLFVDARNESAVRRLRSRKHRHEKPLALMMTNVEMARRYCEFTDAERELLTSAAAPIVLAPRRRAPREAAAPIAPTVAPGHPTLGVMLPYSPLHYLLLAELGFPIVATSGNRADEPLCTDQREAVARLANIADAFLAHDRPIVRPVDDSVVRIVAGRPLTLRRSRGYAPLPIAVGGDHSPILALGAHLKNTVALAMDGNVIISQHLGDLDTTESMDAFERATDALGRLHATQTDMIACDLHPDYASTRRAERMTSAPIRVQHHHAHVVACMAEHGLSGEVLGVCWDGAGYGPDGTIWGGEFLRATRSGFHRLACLRPFPLPGGDRAVREPRRSALALLYEAFGADAMEMEDLPPIGAFAAAERALLTRMLRQRVNTPWTSSIGRLFDGVAALLDIRQMTQYEGQAAMELEFAAARADSIAAYVLSIETADTMSNESTVVDSAARFVVDPLPMVRAMVADLRRGVPREAIAAGFIAALVDAIVAVAVRSGLSRIILTGGCFQNARLLDGAIGKLTDAGRIVYWPQRVPVNDGGIALGQAAVAMSRLSHSEN